jgi:hypothetical protein
VTAGQQPTTEREQLGNRCRAHTEMVIGFIASNDVDSAMAYLGDVEQADGKQMVANIFSLMIVRGNAHLLPDML